MGSSTPQGESFSFNHELWKLHNLQVGDASYKLFMGSWDMQRMTTRKLPLKNYQPFKRSKKSIFFGNKTCAIIIGYLWAL